MKTNSYTIMLKPILTLTAILLLLALPATAGLRQSNVVIKKTGMIQTYDPASLTKPIARKFGEPRRDRGERYFMETTVNDFSTPAFVPKKAQSKPASRMGGESKTLQSNPPSSPSKASSQPSKTASKPNQSSQSLLKPSPSTLKGELSSSATFQKNSRFQRWKSTTGDQLRSTITK